MKNNEALKQQGDVIWNIANLLRGPYLKAEVLSYRPDAWIEHSKIKVGYEIPFNRHFYEYKPPRQMAEIESDIEALEGEIMAMLKAVTA